MRVVATAGHVDHGKSRLVRALTGMEPDRWAEERRRGMTIDLGFAWTTIGEQTLAFVDVPGHERFIGNMLAGVGPAPAVLFVVAADQGWQAQSSEHLAAVRALGLEHVLLAVTRSDLADPTAATNQATAALHAAGLHHMPTVAVSGATGAGLDELRAALSDLVTSLPTVRIDGRVRLWVDRVFTVRGAGTVVTGTLAEGCVSVGDELEIGRRVVRVRGVQALGEPVDSVTAPARVALNLRGVERAELARGDVLLTPGAWPETTVFDAAVDVPARGAWTLHTGSTAEPAHVRPLGDAYARVRIGRSLPLLAGDRVVLREPGTRTIVGATVLDVDPPALRRRGAAGRRATQLETPPGAAAELARRGAVTAARLRLLGFDPSAVSDAVHAAGWLVTRARWQAWADALRRAVSDVDAMSPGLSFRAAADAVGLPDAVLLTELAGHAGLHLADGRVLASEPQASLGRAEDAVRALEQRLADEPFAAPERPELDSLGLGRRELGAAVRARRLLDLPGSVVLRSDAPAAARAVLSDIAQPFTLSQARQALRTTRRVAVPLLEHLDELGVTERVDGQLRRITG